MLILKHNYTTILLETRSIVHQQHDVQKSVRLFDEKKKKKRRKNFQACLVSSTIAIMYIYIYIIEIIVKIIENSKMRKLSPVGKGRTLLGF